MNEEIYKQLAEKFPTYKELSSVPVKDNSEPMMKIDFRKAVRVFSIDERMKKFTGNDIYVRQSVIQKLDDAQNNLASVMEGCALEVVYGYRHLSIQRQIFRQVKKDLTSKNKYSSEDELNEAIHCFIAFPKVAGHPTGGAVDVRIVDADGKPLQMGTDIHAFIEDSYVYSPLINEEAKYNRQILRECMTKAYDGEWWHFSYGDREWALFYEKPNAIYDQIVFEPVLRQNRKSLPKPKKPSL